MQNVFEKTLVEDKELPWEIVGDKVKRKIMSYSKDLMLVKVAFEKGGIGAVHKHPHLQISYIANGVFEITIDGETKLLKEGDVYFVPSDILHGAVCIEDGVLVDVFNPMREDFIHT
ncbi:cupin domain-containing protein [Emticicia soli]|uniref:Cupin domain-containing protein n=1 Tax=Emticicia soli TaxID=2027878 RepID=A0ABW5JDX0_9BACT